MYAIDMAGDGPDFHRHSSILCCFSECGAKLGSSKKTRCDWNMRSGKSMDEVVVHRNDFPIQNDLSFSQSTVWMPGCGSLRWLAGMI